MNVGVDYGKDNDRQVYDVKYFDGYHFGQAGWVCPKCGSIWSPAMIECVKCNVKPPIGVVSSAEALKMHQKPSDAKF